MHAPEVVVPLHRWYIQGLVVDSSRQADLQDAHFCFALSKLVTRSARLLGSLGSAADRSDNADPDSFGDEARSEDADVSARGSGREEGIGEGAKA